MSGDTSQIRSGKISLSMILAFRMGCLSITEDIAIAISSLDLSSPQSISPYVK